MKHRIFLRVFAGYIALSILAVLVFAFYTLQVARGISHDSLTRGLEIAARTALASVAPLMAQGRSAALDALAAAVGREGRVRLTLITAGGVVLADTEQDPAVMENHSDRPEVAVALKGEVGTSSRFSGTVRRWMVYVAVPVKDQEGRVSGVVRASAYAEELEALSRQGRGSLALFASVLLAACLLSALVLSRTISSPLQDLAQVVGRFAAGDFGARLHLRRQDEVKILADSFNAMGERVQSLFEERARRMLELDGIFSSVQQGILVLDKDGRIVRSNKGFEKLAVSLPVEGRTLWEVVRAPRLTEIVQQARVTAHRQSEEVEIGDKSVHCTVERMGKREELIVVLNDTSDLRRLEALKRDFVVNASHELRTPLTSIMGSLEMLEGALKGESARWVETIRRNAERMTAIVQDLLLLSGLEARGAEPSADSLDLERLIRDVTGMFAHRAETQGIGLAVDIPSPLPPITADAYLLEQVLVNLIDNALKYTEEGEVRVTCAREGPDKVRIEVADTGVGIPEESLSRVFERFYVVDKSRSRKLGGTGLGLAIVKHIVQSHVGTIDVESTVGKGTRFIVRLPIDFRSTGN
ncbi:MAG: ATP-binding protein [Spirochaetia bacterium]|jgi:two-component system phosphate regulon sensor histidine kinase PhoR